MADLRIPSIDFPGSPGVIDLNYTLCQGVHPNTVTMTVQVETGAVAPFGDLTLSDNVEPPVTISDCRVTNARQIFGTDGRRWVVTLEDGRWRWKYAVIHGHYNQLIPRMFDAARVPNYGETAVQPVVAQLAGQSDQFTPPLQEWSRKSAQDLCKLCLEAMQVESYDISAIPTDQYPEVFWDAVFAATELDNLANAYGCRVCWNPETTQVTLARVGSGADLPPATADELQRDGIGVDMPQPPQQITVYGAPKVWQVRFSLEAVAKDFDGQYKPLDDVSYRPKDGWGKVPPPFWPFALPDTATAVAVGLFNADQLPGDRTPLEALALAQESVYRCYRIKETIPKLADDVMRFPVDSRERKDRRDRFHIILLDYLPEATYDDLGQRTLMPPRVYGRAWRLDGLRFARTTGPGEQVRCTFSVDPVQRLIRFDEYVALLEKQPNDPAPRWHAAQLYLEGACYVLGKDTHQPERYSKPFPLMPRKTSGNDQPSSSSRPSELAVVKDEIRYFERIDYTATNEINTRTTNRPEAEEKATFFANGEAAMFQVPTPQDRLYNGVKRVYVDGAIQQVTWMLSMGGAVTRATRNNEHSVVIPPYEVRRAWEPGSADGLAAKKRQIEDLRRRERPDNQFKG